MNIGSEAVAIEPVFEIGNPFPTNDNFMGPRRSCVSFNRLLEYHHIMNDINGQDDRSVGLKNDVESNISSRASSVKSIMNLRDSFVTR